MRTSSMSRAVRNGSDSVNRLLLLGYLLIPALVLATPMDSFRNGSGLGTFGLYALLNALLMALVAAYGFWVIGSGVWAWVQGECSELQLFFVICRGAVVLLLASLLVDFVA